MNPNSLLALSSAPLSKALREHAATRRYQHNQLIHNRGSNTPGLSIIKSGVANVGINGADGRFFRVGLLGEGDCFGEFTLFTKLPRTHDIWALGETEIYHLSKSSFTKLKQRHPELTEVLLQTTLVKLHLLLEMLDAMQRLPLISRMAKFLIILSQTSGQTQRLPCTQQDLANNLGVSRVSAGKALGKLVEMSLIKLNYGSVDILDGQNLQHWINQQTATSQLNLKI